MIGKPGQDLRIGSWRPLDQHLKSLGTDGPQLVTQLGRMRGIRKGLFELHPERLEIRGGNQAAKKWQ